MGTEQKLPDLGGMSDAEISELDATAYDELAKASEEARLKEEEEDDDVDSNSSSESEDQDDDQNDESDDTGGADDDDDSDDDSDSSDDSSEENDDDDSNEDDDDSDAGDDEKDDQSDSDDTDDDDDTDTSTGDPDFKAEYAKVMAPFKAANRTITPRTVDEVRRLMQMGVDYSRKMEAMKPYQRVLKTLERNNLLDIEKVNFWIDLDKKNPDAIKKFLKDSKIDPIELDLEDSGNYSPTDHSPGDQELAIDEVLDSLRPSPQFDNMVNVITNEWGKDSRDLLADHPEALSHIVQHMEAGIYEMIADRAANDKILGNSTGLSDLEAYKLAGDALAEEGAFNQATSDGNSASATKATRARSQDSKGSRTSRKNVQARKRAASPTKGNATARKKKAPDFLGGMTDAEIEKFDASTL